MRISEIREVVKRLLHRAYVSDGGGLFNPTVCKLCGNRIVRPADGREHKPTCDVRKMLAWASKAK